jgi:hypothetical protein
MMAKESNEVAGVNLPANVVFTHNGSNTMYVGNRLSKRDDKEERDGGTVVDGIIERMELTAMGVMIHVDKSQEKPGRLLLTPSGMLILMRREPKP